MSNQKNSSTRLLVCEERSDGSSTVEADETFVIDEALCETSEDEYDLVYRELSNAEIDIGLSFPVYEVAWEHLISNRRGRLLELVLLYKRLEETIATVEPDTVVCSDDLDQAYQAVLKDVGTAHNITVKYHIRPEIVSKLQRFVVSSVLLLPFVLDQLLGLLLKRVNSHSSDTEIVFVPGLNRLDSMTPVLEQVDRDFEVVIASMASSWLWKVRHSGLDQFAPVPVSQYATIGSLVNQLSAHVSLCRHVLFGNSLKHAIGETLSSELNVEMSRTIVYSIQQGFRTRMFGSIYLYFQFENVFDEVSCDSVVIGSLSPAGRSIISKGIENGVDPYHIPHGVGAGGDCPNPPPELTQFVSGELEKRHYGESSQVKKPWNCVATGRPYLTNLYNSYAKSNTEQAVEPYHIVLATQPIDVRQEFVATVIKALTRTEHEVRVTIKIHPSESSKTYAKYEKKNDYVTIAESNLHELLCKADLTLTVNSNVGIESIIVGTPSVCLNWWNPVISVPMYAKYNGVPVLTGSSEVNTFFNKMSKKTLTNLLADETKFVNEFYNLNVDAAHQMATELKSTKCMSEPTNQ